MVLTCGSSEVDDFTAMHWHYVSEVYDLEAVDLAVSGLMAYVY